jgi:cytoskeletal protein RodZ
MNKNISFAMGLSLAMVSGSGAFLIGVSKAQAPQQMAPIETTTTVVETTIPQPVYIPSSKKTNRTTTTVKSSTQAQAASVIDSTTTTEIHVVLTIPAPIPTQAPQITSPIVIPTVAPTTPPTSPPTTVRNREGGTTRTTIAPSPMPVGCVQGKLEDNGVWNCQH